MLGDRRAQDIVNSQERIHEICAVRQIHITVPRCADREVDREPRQNPNAHECTKVPPQYEKYEDNQTGQKNPDGAFGQCRQSRTGIRGVEISSPARFVAEEKRRKRPPKKDKKAHIRKNELRKHGIEHTGAEDQRRPKGCPLVIEAPRKGVSQEKPENTEEGGEKPRGKICHAERRKRRDQLPVKEDGLIIPIIAIDLRREIIPRSEHFLRGLGIVHLDRCRNGQGSVAPKVEDGEQKERAAVFQTVVHTSSSFAAPCRLSCAMR